MFGYPGGAVLFTTRYSNKKYSVRQGKRPSMLQMLLGLVRKLGLFSCSGPGVTNAVTGIATAYMDSVPMVIITGKFQRMPLDLMLFKCDVVGITSNA